MDLKLRSLLHCTKHTQWWTWSICYFSISFHSSDT